MQQHLTDCFYAKAALSPLQWPCIQQNCGTVQFHSVKYSEVNLKQVFTVLVLKKKTIKKTSSWWLNIQFLNMHFQLVAFKRILTSDAVFAALGMNFSFMLLYNTIYLCSVSTVSFHLFPSKRGNKTSMACAAHK